MKPDAQVRRIMEHLLKKSRAREVTWRESDADASTRTVHLPVATVHLTYVSPSADPDKIVFAVSNQQGQGVGVWIVEEYDPEWQTAIELYDLATLGARGGNKLLDELETSLAGKGEIGQ